MAKNPLNRKAYRKYMGLLKEQNKEKKPTEAPKSTTNFVHQMADGRKVDENGEIHNTQPTKELNRQQLRKIQRYDKDPRGRLTPLGKQQRLKYRLNIAIIILVLLIITTYLILFFVG
ncbi:hypothetical protein [Periweissella beninensis]|uniref:Triple QxxK/R motif-containing protein n=1 Tax=Periweissella beninensis TaxID=504936 RepID=A0ABT0VGN1_9LACO|nr:hypothetical protein [Periweissella beninensis]MBM7543801.1 hypothetical protein [Periweissella beninensis]MCM2436816.1 hypothetical protein [Periweissella beninensis]MCT4395477.1 hypothetical protein [Periweissella beninensis]